MIILSVIALAIIDLPKLVSDNLRDLVFLGMGSLLTLVVLWVLERYKMRFGKVNERRVKIYAPLFDELLGVQSSLGKYDYVSTSEYEKIKSAHLSYMVPNALRQKMRRLYDELLPEIQRRIVVLREKHQESARALTMLRKKRSLGRAASAL